MLAFFLPALPFLHWMSGVIGWGILMIEAIVAAPLWALAHALPRGEGFTGDHGIKGYMILMRILFQPALMVVGFFVGYLLISSAGWALGTGMKVMWAGTTHGVTSLTGAVIYIAILTGLITILAHKSYSLIGHLPEHVFRWVGEGALGGGSEGDSR